MIIWYECAARRALRGGAQLSENNPMREPRFLLVTLLIAAAAALRVVPYGLARAGWVNVTEFSSSAWNVQPVTALCLFAGAYFAAPAARYLMPMLVMLLSNLAIGLVMSDAAFYTFHSSIAAQFAGFLAVAWVGSWLSHSRRTMPRVAAAALGAELAFFAISNLGYWALSDWYPHTWAGFADCYVKAIPFLYRSLLGTAIYTAALFGAAELACARFPAQCARPTGLAAARG